MSCDYWNENIFIKFCQHRLSMEERQTLSLHLEQCEICRNKFVLCWETLIDHSEPAQLETECYLDSERWQQIRARLADQLSRSIQPLPQPVEPIPLHRRRSPSQILKIAAMVLIMVAPLLMIAITIKQRQANSTSNNSNGQQTTTRHLEIEAELEKFKANLEHPATPQPSRYDRLDIAINDYLLALKNHNQVGASNALSSAESLAKEMLEQSTDHYGHDLVSYYRSIPLNKAGLLLDTRKVRDKIERDLDNESASEILDKLTQCKTTFEELGSTCDIESINIQFGKYLSKIDQLGIAHELLKVSIDQSIERHHLKTYVELLFEDGNNDGEEANFAEAKRKINLSIKIAERLDIPGFYIRSTMLLATINHLTNDDQQALELASKSIQTAISSNHPVSLQALQILAISSFKLSDIALADHCFELAITLGEKQNKPAYLALTYTLYGIVRAEQHRFNEADQLFNKAFVSVDNVSDKIFHDNVYISAKGYYAREQSLAGHFDTAIAAYTEAITLSEKIGAQQQLALSQLHQGLAESLLAVGDKKRAESEMIVSVDLANKARLGNEINNDLLSYAVTHKNPADLLKSIQTN